MNYRIEYFTTSFDVYEAVDHSSKTLPLLLSPTESVAVKGTSFMFGFNYVTFKYVKRDSRYLSYNLFCNFYIIFSFITLSFNNVCTIYVGS